MLSAMTLSLFIPWIEFPSNVEARMFKLVAVTLSNKAPCCEFTLDDILVSEIFERSEKSFKHTPLQLFLLSFKLEMLIVEFSWCDMYEPRSVFPIARQSVIAREMAPFAITIPEPWFSEEFTVLRLTDPVMFPMLIPSFPFSRTVVEEIFTSPCV